MYVYNIYIQGSSIALNIDIEGFGNYCVGIKSKPVVSSIRPHNMFVLGTETLIQTLLMYPMFPCFLHLSRFEVSA